MGLFSDMFSKRPLIFAEAIAGKIERQFPPSNESQLFKKGAQRRLEAIVETIMSDLVNFQGEIKLGWIGKSRLGNAFRWKLVDLGYSKKFVETLTKIVITRIAS